MKLPELLPPYNEQGNNSTDMSELNWSKYKLCYECDLRWQQN